MSTTPDEDTAVSHADEPQPSIPAEGAPHAWVLPMIEDGLYRNPAGGQVRLVQMLRKPLAPGTWSAMVPGIFGDHYAEVTAEGLAACGYTLVTEEPQPEYPRCPACFRVQVHGTVFAECECP